MPILTCIIVRMMLLNGSRYDFSRQYLWTNIFHNNYFRPYFNCGFLRMKKEGLYIKAIIMRL